MARQSRRASPEGIKRAKTALTAHQLTYQRLAKELVITRQPVFKFFAGEVVDNKIFVQICEKLGLNWQEIKVQDKIDIDALVQKVRQHCYKKIQMLYGKMQLLDIAQPVDIDKLYVDVNILYLSISNGGKLTVRLGSCN
jgi:predicted NACHT family NTPase